MKRNDAFEHYKSGINKVRAKANPFADAADLSEDAAPDDAPRTGVKIRSNTRLFIAAALLICISVSAFLLVLHSCKIGFGDKSNGSIIENSDTSIAVTEPSVTTTEPIIITSQSSSLTFTSSLATTEASSSSSDMQNKLQHSYPLLSDAIKAYRAAEDEIQKTLDEFQIERMRVDFSSDDRKTYQDKLNGYSAQQREITEWIKQSDFAKKEIIVLDSRRVSNDDSTIKLVIMNRNPNTLTLKDYINVSINDRKTSSANFSFDKQCTLPGNGEISTLYIKAEGISFSELIKKAEVLDIDIESKTIDAYIYFHAQMPDGKEQYFDTYSWFDLNKYAISQEQEEKLYTQKPRQGYDNLVVIGK